MLISLSCLLASSLILARITFLIISASSLILGLNVFTSLLLSKYLEYICLQFLKFASNTTSRDVLLISATLAAT